MKFVANLTHRIRYSLWSPHLINVYGQRHLCGAPRLSGRCGCGWRCP